MNEKISRSDAFLLKIFLKNVSRVNVTFMTFMTPGVQVRGSEKPERREWESKRDGKIERDRSGTAI